MITRQQLQDGVWFKYGNDKYHLKYTEVDDYKLAYISHEYTGYECNVTKIGTKSFTIFTHVMGKKVTVKVNYSDCELVD